MSLLAPLALVGLLLIPVLVVLYMLRARRQEVVVSSILLWQRSRNELQARRPLRRLERNLLLLLQILLVTVLTLALARPVVRIGMASGEPLALVLDVSASMQATDVAPSRFEASRREALALIRRLRHGQEAMLIAAASTPRVIAGFTSDHPRLERALRALQPTDAQGDLTSAVTLAMEQKKDVKIVIFTDGTEPVPTGPGIEIYQVGWAEDNVGIVWMQSGSDPASRGLVLVRIQNFSRESKAVPLVLYADGRPAAEERVSLSGGEGRSLVFPVSPKAGALRAVLEVEDYLSADNQGFAAVEPLPLPSVLLVSRGNPYLERLLKVLPLRAVSLASRLDPSTWAKAEVVVLDRTPPVALPPGNYLLIGTVASNLPIALEGTLDHPRVAWQDEAHPMLRFVDLKDLRIRRALAVKPQGGQVLAGGEGPLLWIYEGKGTRVILLPFDLEESDLVLKASFPILISNALAWLGEVQGTRQAGDVLTLPSVRGTDALLVLPSKEEVPPAFAGGVWRLDRAGFYLLKTPSGERRIAVNVASPQESAIAPRFAPTTSVPHAGGQVEGRRELWPWGVGLGLLLALGEWFLFLRRQGRRARRLEPAPQSGNRPFAPAAGMRGEGR